MYWRLNSTHTELLLCKPAYSGYDAPSKDILDKFLIEMTVEKKSASHHFK
jgi:hypothetical protein